MALVFISHAHGDEALVRRVLALLRDGLELNPDDFFVSSQGGRGVAPAARIRDEILTRLSAARALVVLVTPRSAGSPWVWIEAGNRLGRPDQSNPFFVVPSERFVARLLEPVADLRCICLDRQDDLHELVRAVGETLGRPVQDVFAYNTALAELVRASQTAYSPFGERVGHARAWLKANAAAVLVAGLAVVAVALYNGMQLAEARRTAEAAQQQLATLNGELTKTRTDYIEAMNEEVSRTASRYLILKGVVMSAQQPVVHATVTASLSAVGADCEEPECTSGITTSLGEFRLDLARIQAQNGDDVLLSVMKPGFEVFTKNVRVDVRAMDVGLPAHTVALRPAGVSPGPQP